MKSRLVLAAAVISCASVAAWAQNYPVKAIRFIVTAPAGGGVDILARLIGQRLSESMGQQVVVDNRAGASGAIGVELTARSAPDGYTMMIAGSNFLIYPLLKANVPYSPLKDFTPVTLATTSPNILVVHPSMAVASVQDLIALAKSRPGKLNYAAGSSGASPHLAAELFKAMAGVDIVHVPYKGSAPALIDLIAGQVDLMFATAISVVSHIKSGKLKALAITSASRSALAPELPTVAASGLPGYESGVTYGILVRSGTSPDIVRKLNEETVRILQRADIKERLLADGTEVVASSPEYYARVMRDEIAKWGKLIKVGKIRLE